MNESKVLSRLLEIEERLIEEKILHQGNDVNGLAQINSNLSLVDQLNPAFSVHAKMIKSLCNHILVENEIDLGSFLLKEEFSNQDVINFDFSMTIDDVEAFHIHFLNSIFLFGESGIYREKSKQYLKEIGAVYTLDDIAKEIVLKTLKRANIKGGSLSNLNILDFACGTGRFYFQCLDILTKDFGFKNDSVLTENLYGIDVDDNAVMITRCRAILLLESKSQDNIRKVFKNIICKNGLKPSSDLFQVDENSLDFQNDFNGIISNGGFDVIFSNPPYFLLKANKPKDAYLQKNFERVKEKMRSEIQFFKTCGYYRNSIEGMLNYYQLSIEMITNITKDSGSIGIICPSSIFADLTASKLRKYLLTSNTIDFIRYYGESEKLFENVSQSTVIFTYRKGGVSSSIDVEFGDEKFKVDFKTIFKVFQKNLEIPLVDKTGWGILNKISDKKKLKQLPFIRNKRGELDLTLYKDCIIKDGHSDYRLVRGNMITSHGIKDKNNEFVNVESFLERKSPEYKELDFGKRRLICQQISNVDLKKRMKFSISEPTDIIANSCNYLVSLRNEDDIDKLMLLLNSAILNWRFKVSSTNNHINNYELDELPILDLENFEVPNSVENIDEWICQQYGLNQVEIDYVIEKIK